MAAITGLVPDGMVRAIAAFLEFCYIVRRSQVSDSDLKKLDDAVQRFHTERDIFIDEGVHVHFNLP